MRYPFTGAVKWCQAIAGSGGSQGLPGDGAADGVECGRRNKDGSEVRYLQLAHNVWDPQKHRSAVQVIYNFGREDNVSWQALDRLV